MSIKLMNRLAKHMSGLHSEGGEMKAKHKAALHESEDGLDANAPEGLGEKGDLEAGHAELLEELHGQVHPELHAKIASALASKLTKKHVKSPSMAGSQGKDVDEGGGHA